MRCHLFWVFLGMLLTIQSGVTLAQTGKNPIAGQANVPEQRPPIFPQLFPQPTHDNGYEEWVLAADLIRNNTAIDEATQPGATLTFKRHVLADRGVVEALALLHEGLKKPIRSPHENIDETTLLPELALFRKLARLLRTVQYVNFADGRVDAAIDTLRDGLTFAYYIQTDTLISGLVGLAIDTILLDEFARHFDQLSVFQCERVLRMAQDFLKAESPAIHLFAMEKASEVKMLEARRGDANALLTFLNDFGISEDPETSMQVQQIHNHLSTHPADLNAMLNEAQARINAQFDQAILNLRLPLAQRKPFVMDKSNAPAALLANLLTTDPQSIIDRYTGDQAKLRLLALHALIRSYRWEHDTLPPSLNDLHADELVTDPFTGDKIVYQPEGDRYTLYSAGPLQRDESGPGAKQERVPVKLINR